MRNFRLVLGKALRKLSLLVMEREYEKALFIENCRQKGYQAFFNDKNLTVHKATAQDIQLRLPPSSDMDVFSQIIFGEEYKPLVDAARLNSFEIKTIIDCGANVGLTSLYLLSEFKGSYVYAVEADPENYASMLRNVSTNPNIITLHNAIWFENTSLSLNRDFRDGRDWSVTVSKAIEEQPSSGLVNGITIEQICQRHNIRQIDILKVDIEGAEAEIFSKPEYCSFLGFTKIVALEIHDEFGIRERIYNTLKTYGFIIFNSKETTIAVNSSFLTVNKPRR